MTGILETKSLPSDLTSMPPTQDIVLVLARLLRRNLKKDVLHFPCRHHIMELIIGSAFEKVTATSTGPEIQIFKRFQQWLDIDHGQFAPANTDTSVEVQIASCRNDLFNFICHQLEFQQPHNDYKEFLELSLIYLGEIPALSIHFQAPGAMHRARWMAKVIYSIKMWLFCRQFIMTHADMVFVIRPSLLLKCT